MALAASCETLDQTRTLLTSGASNIRLRSPVKPSIFSSSTKLTWLRDRSFRISSITHGVLLF
jgi:hypothetical protein